MPGLRRFLVAAASLASLALTAAVAAPGPGRYDGELCVALSAAAPTCGKADVRLGRTGAVNIQVNDIAYRLQLHGSQIDVVLMQGTVQLDEFTSPYVWVGRALQFADSDKEARYEVRFAERRR